MVTGRVVSLIVIVVLFCLLLGYTMGNQKVAPLRPEHLTGLETNVRRITLTSEEYAAILPCLREYWRQFDTSLACWENIHAVCDGEGVEGT